MREGRMLRIECEFISHGRSHKDCIHKCTAKLNNQQRGIRGLEGGEDSDDSQVKGATIRSAKSEETRLWGSYSDQVSHERTRNTQRDTHRDIQTHPYTDTHRISTSWKGEKILFHQDSSGMLVLIRVQKIFWECIFRTWKQRQSV